MDDKYIKHIKAYKDFYYFFFTNNIHLSWLPFFKKNWKLLNSIIRKIYKLPKYFPTQNNIFKVFTSDINNIKIVLLGQDPYHKKTQAHGLAFSVPHDVHIPPSLWNIFKEINNEYDNKYKFKHGNLTKWFEYGIFLLNTSLTVLPATPGSHMKLWKEFTDKVIKYLSKRKQIIFVLLGNHAKQKKIYLNNNIVVEGVHPSPLSAHNGFFNSDIFKIIDKYYYNLYGKYIDWQN